MKRKKFYDVGERILVNCINNEIGYVKRIYVGEVELVEIGLIDNLRIRLFGNEVVIELRCVWREGVLFEIMDVISNFYLDLYLV